MQRSDSIAKLAPAFVSAQGELDNVAKDAQNPHFRSSYASLPAILDAVRPVLARHKLGVMQFPVDCGEGRVGVETIVMHESGEFMCHTYSARAVKDDPQGYGSAITYARRYALAAVLGISQDDDDGNAASAAPRRQQRQATREEQAPYRGQEARVERPAAATKAPGKITAAQRNRLFAIVGEEGKRANLTAAQAHEELRSVASRYGYASSADITTEHYDTIIAEAQKTLRAMGDPASQDRAADRAFE